MALKLHYCENVRCSIVQTKWHLRKHCENYCGVNYIFVKLYLF
jgi:hypothetical protein